MTPSASRFLSTTANDFDGHRVMRTYGVVRGITVRSRGAAGMIGASNFFELSVAVAISLFGLSSGAALATVVDVLVEVPAMLSMVAIVMRSKCWYQQASLRRAAAATTTRTRRSSSRSPIRSRTASSPSPWYRTAPERHIRAADKPRTGELQWPPEAQ